MAKQKIVIIGISTGGPKTLRSFFQGMPRIAASILVVRHMPRFVNDSVRQTLEEMTDMDVRIAAEGDVIQPGTVYLAPSEVHMKLVANHTVHLDDSPRVCYVRPAVDVTMQSVQPKAGDSVIGVVMTGMGSDGAQGVRHVRAIGGVTVAQDQATSVVWGMPKAAIDTGCVDHVLSPDAIRQRLVAHAR